MAVEPNVIVPDVYDLASAVRVTPNLSPYDNWPIEGTGPIDQPLTQNRFEIEIPAMTAINLYRSKLRFRLQFNRPAAAVPIQWSILKTRVPPIDQFRMFTRKGVHLVNLPHFQEYWNVVAAPSLKAEVAKNRRPAMLCDNAGLAEAMPFEFGAAASSTVYGPYRGIGATEANILGAGAATATDIVSSGSPLQFVCADDGTLPGSTLRMGSMSTTINNVPPPCAFAARTVATTTAAGAWYVDYDMTLGDLVGSFLAWDKTIMFPETVVLQVVFANHNTFAFVGNGTSDTDNKAALYTGNTTGYQESLTNAQTATNTLAGYAGMASVFINNFRLRLMQDLNPLATSQWMNRLQSGGMTMNLPWVRMWMMNAGAAARATGQFRIGSADGQTLLRIHSVLRNSGNQTLQSGYVFYNEDTALTANYRTSVNNKPLQIADIKVAENHDWEYNQNHLRGTLLSTSSNYRACMPIHIDLFGGGDLPISEAAITDFHKSGLPINGPEVLYRREENEKAAIQLEYIFGVVTQKILQIAPTSMGTM